MSSEETKQLLDAFEKVGDKVEDLKTSFDKKSREDEQRFVAIESSIEMHTKQLAQHAILHAQHAQMISAAQDLALTKVGQEWSARLASVENQSKSQGEKLDTLFEQGQNIRKIMNTIAINNGSKIGKALYFVGAMVWGLVTAYLATHR